MTMHRRDFLDRGIRALAGGAVLLAVPSGQRAFARQGAYLERSVFAMGTNVVVSAYGHDRAQILHATSRAFDELHRLDRLLSVFRPDSDLSRLNRSAGERPVEVDASTLEVLRAAKDAHTATGGAFDTTVEPLLRRHGFRDEAGEEAIVTGDRYVDLLPDGRAVIAHPAVRVDAGGIAVGYAVDRMVRILRDEGIDAALVNHGGDVYALGAPPDAEGWSIIVPHPAGDDAPVAELVLKDRALSTSTNLLNVRSADGTTRGHIFDPRTGENPVGCTSMTVLSGRSVDADALSTALFVRPELRSAPGSSNDVIALLPSGERWMSDTIRSAVRNEGGW